MKRYKMKKILLAAGMVIVSGFSSCSLDEYNPSGYTFETLAASSVEGYQSILNNIYFGMERAMYGYNQWMQFTEAGTDIWVAQKGVVNAYFNYGIGSDYPNNMMSGVLNAAYDGIGSCNFAIKLAPKAPFQTEEERNAKVAEARFMRAMYYYHLIEQFGGITLQMEPVDDVDLHPAKNSPLDIYKQCIIPDLEFAADWLPVEDRTTRPSRKSAMGFLARVYLQSVEYDSSKEYASKALELAKKMIADCEAGGATYGIKMYEAFDDVFAQDNNYTNEEALWKHRYVVGGVSNNGWVMNTNDEQFYCPVSSFSAIKFNNTPYTKGPNIGKTDYEIWGGRSGGSFMPSKYLLDLYIQEDGTLDPRYHKSFQTEWNANKESGFKWGDSQLKMYDRTEEVTNTTAIAFGELAVKFFMPGDMDYANLAASKRSLTYLGVDYADVYNANGDVKTEYQRVVDGEKVVNPFFNFHPSLTKHNSNNYYVNNVSKKRFGNQNATFMMRTPEVYLIAAEADIYVNGASDAMGYINKVRARAGAKPLPGTATIQTVLDERARELCGEYVRFYDLKRTGKLNKEYLESKNPSVGYYFVEGKHEVRPFPASFLENLQEGGVYYQNNGY